MHCLQTTDCNVPLGMKDKTIPDSSITASSELVDPNDGSLYKTYDGRLDNTRWWGPVEDQGSWVQVDFGYPQVKLINGIITQGSTWWSRWVETLKVEYGNSEDALIPILAGAGPKVYPKKVGKHVNALA